MAATDSVTHTASAPPPAPRASARPAAQHSAERWIQNTPHLTVGGPLTTCPTSLSEAHSLHRRLLLPTGRQGIGRLCCVLVLRCSVCVLCCVQRCVVFLCCVLRAVCSVQCAVCTAVCCVQRCVLPVCFTAAMKAGRESRSSRARVATFCTDGPAAAPAEPSPAASPPAGSDAGLAPAALAPAALAAAALAAAALAAAAGTAWRLCLRLRSAGRSPSRRLRSAAFDLQPTTHRGCVKPSGCSIQSSFGSFGHSVTPLLECRPLHLGRQ